jgi:transcriptional regulator with XRE-family HTH domain
MNYSIKGGVLRRARLLAGLSMRELGERAGLNSETVRSVETGERLPYPATVKAIADALQIDMADLYVFDDDVVAS